MVTQIQSDLWGALVECMATALQRVGWYVWMCIQTMQHILKFWFVACSMSCMATIDKPFAGKGPGHHRHQAVCLSLSTFNRPGTPYHRTRDIAACAMSVGGYDAPNGQLSVVCRRSCCYRHAILISPAQQVQHFKTCLYPHCIRLLVNFQDFVEPLCGLQTPAIHSSNLTGFVCRQAAGRVRWCIVRNAVNVFSGEDPWPHTSTESLQTPAIIMCCSCTTNSV